MVSDNIENTKIIEKGGKFLEKGKKGKGIA